MDSDQLSSGGFDDVNALSPVEFESSISTGSRASTKDGAIQLISAEVRHPTRGLCVASLWRPCIRRFGAESGDITLSGLALMLGADWEAAC